MKTKKIRTGAADIPAELLTRWDAAMNVLDGYTKKQVENFFFCLKRSIITRIMARAGSDARLSTWDEQIFEYYKRLMEYYNDTVVIYVQEKEKIKNTRIKVILGGIYSVLSSELKQYRDGIQDMDQNPVYIEKKEIIRKSVELFLKSFDESIKGFNKERLTDCLAHGRQAMAAEFSYKSSADVMGFLIAENETYHFEHIYKCYREAADMCVQRLNDAATRPVTYYYYDFLKKEQDILSSIIKIQVNALEREIEKITCRPEEKALVNIILSNLREGYQYLGGEIKDIMANFKDASDKDANMAMESYDEFVPYIKKTMATFSAHTFENVQSEYNEKLELFTQSLRAEACFICDKRLGAYELNKSIYESKKRISETVAMADELIMSFKRLTVYYSENGESLSGTEGSEIIKGINETIEIKIESIDENKQIFADNCLETIKGYAADNKHITPEEKDKLYEMLYNEWRNVFLLHSLYEQKTAKDVKVFLDDILCCEQAAAIMQRTERLRQSREEQINKKILEFKREHLLYEISTFEEILLYSVSRLREIDVPAAAGYAEQVDLTTADIKVILKKNNITVIEPAPYDIFNGKEHEVLMAEKNDLFKKGEIIKLMNSGYKQNDTVILRANVIAAK